jgi:small-conductance mechanosensitive channel
MLALPHRHLTFPSAFLSPLSFPFSYAHFAQFIKGSSFYGCTMDARTIRQRRNRRRVPRSRKKPAAPSSRLIGRTVGGARLRLRGYRHASMLAIALTGLLLLIFTPGETAAPPEEPGSGGVAAAPEPMPDIEELVPQAAGELRSAIDNLLSGFLLNLPKFIVAAIILLVAGWVARLLRHVIRRLSSRWERGDAIGVMVMAGFWIFSLGIAISIIAGDLRALVGSLGLVGLALSWALQIPIESFTGWLLNSFKGYYRVGDRIAVGEIFGDVYRIDVLTTTVWEIGGPDRPAGHVHAEQPTGRLITFPNNEILTGTVVNLTKDFPYVWNELAIMLAAESDVEYAMAILNRIADSVLKNYMHEPAQRYAAILRAKGLEDSVPDRPQLYASLAEEGILITVRYLVNARQRRVKQSELTRRIVAELRQAEHEGRILAYFPRRQVQIVDAQGHPGAAWPLA